MEEEDFVPAEVHICWEKTSNCWYIVSLCHIRLSPLPVHDFVDVRKWSGKALPEISLFDSVQTKPVAGGAIDLVNGQTEG